MESSLERVRRVKRDAEREWLALPGVVAVGIGQDGGGAPVIVVSVEALTESVRESLPPQREGVAVEIRVTGPIQPW
jgi:hypothetical protein